MKYTPVYLFLAFGREGTHSLRNPWWTLVSSWVSVSLVFDDAKKVYTSSCIFPIHTRMRHPRGARQKSETKATVLQRSKRDSKKKPSCDFLRVSEKLDVIFHQLFFFLVLVTLAPPVWLLKWAFRKFVPLCVPGHRCIFWVAMNGSAAKPAGLCCSRFPHIPDKMGRVLRFRLKYRPNDGVP